MTTLTVPRLRTAPVTLRRTSQHAALLLGAGVAAAYATSNRAVAVAAWVAPLLTVRFLRTAPARTGLVAAALVHAAAFSWAWQHQWPVPPLLLAGLGTLFYLPYVADRLLATRLGPLAGSFVLPAAWIALEHALVRVPLLEGSPIGAWAAVVHSQHGQDALLQVLAVTGSAGVTFLVMWTATVTNLVWERGVASVVARRTGAVLLATLVATVSAGGAVLASTGPATSTVRAAGVAIDNDEILGRTWSPVRRGDPLTDADRQGLGVELAVLHDQLFAASELEVAAGARIVAWAEDNALVFRDDADALVERGRAFARRHGIALIMGMVVLAPGEPADNQAVGITPDGEVAFTYLKSHPAPGEGSRPGDGRIAFMDTPWGRVGVAICFDYDFPALIRQAGHAGVDIMINPADDTAAIDPLHPNMAVPRAIENGFAMLRPAQGARSIAVDAYGRTLAVQDDTGPVRHLAVDLPTTGRRTLAPLVGDVPAHLAVAGLALAGVVVVRRGRRCHERSAAPPA